MNDQTLQALIVDDSEDDALLIIRELKKGGYNPVYERVETAARMKKALREKQWDIILCDYKMPNFNATSAIALLKETNIDIPLIIISGAIGEETAIECMRLGAHDYFMKGKLSRLCPAIARELEEAKVRNKQKQAESQRKAVVEALHRSEEKYRNILENIEDGYYEVDLAGNLTFFNDSLCRLYGYSKDELMGMNYRQYADKETAKKVFQAFNKAYSARETIKEFNWQATRKDGAKRYVEVSISLQKDSSDNPTGFRGIIRDVTERKQAEYQRGAALEALRQSEEKYRNILKNIEDGYYETDLAGNFTFFNDSLCQIHGYSKDELMGMNNRQYEDKETIKKVFQMFNKVYKTGNPIKGFDRHIIRKDGTKRYIEVSASLLKDSSGKPIGFRGITRDITARKEAEETLKENENKYRLLADNVNDVIFVLDMNLKFTYVSPSTKILRGYEPEESMNLSLTETLAPSSMELALKTLSEVMELEKIKKVKINESRTIPLEVMRKDGTAVWTEVKLSFIRDENQQAVGILGVTRDITERRKMEEEIRQSEERYRTILDEMENGYFEVDLAGNYTFVNDANTRQLGYSKEEMLGLNFRVPMVKESIDIVRNAFSNIYITGQPQRGISYKAKRKDGTTGFAEISGFPMKNEKGETIGFRGMALDITERKQMELLLRESDERYRALFNSSIDLVYLYDFEGRFIDANTAALTRFGYTREEIRSLNFASLLSEDQLPLAFKTLQEIQETGIQKNMAEFRLRHKNGSDVYVETIGSTIMSDGKSVAIQSIARDITERKQSEEILQQSEEKYRTIIENIEDGYVELDLKGNFTFFNDALCKIQGYPKDELLKLAYSDLMDKENAQKIYKQYNKAFTTGQSEKGVEYEVITKNGERKYLETSITPIKDASGHVVAFRGIVRDRTERKEAEARKEAMLEALRQSEEKYRTILENMQESYYELDLAGNLTFVNDAVCRNIGYSKDELIGMNYRQFTEKEEIQRVFQVFSKIYTTGEPLDEFGWRIIRKDGTKMYIEGSVSLKKDSEGKTIGFKGMHHDITERKLSEELLKQSEGKYRTIIEQMTDGYFETDLSGKFTLVNDAECVNLGFSREELIGRDRKLYADEKTDKALYRLFAEVYKTGFPVKAYALEIIKKDGTKAFHEISVSLIRNSKGEPSGFRGIARDVTERKKAEEELRQSEEKFRNIIENIKDGYIEVDLSGNWTFVNDAVAEHTLYSREELTGMHYNKLQTEESIKNTFKIFNEIYKTGKPVKAVAIEGLRKDGTIGYYEFSISLHKNSNGKPIGFHCISRDITERKKTEKELLDLNHELESVIAEATGLAAQADLANAAKSDFLANMSHEIRTPMNAIIGMADLLWDSQLTAEQRQYVEIFRSAGENLLILINDILDLSKVESGQLVLENMPYDLFDIVDKTCEVVALRAHSRNLELLCHINPDVPQYIMGDPTRLRQVLMNILGNAVKFTEKGEIALTVLPLPQDVSEKTPRFLQFSIRDTGIGIPADKLNIVFEKFTQSDNSITRKYEGTGLGLAISKQFIELMGGKIRVESRDGEGSTFFFTIPLEEAPPEKNQKPAFGQEVDLQGVNILIVDDNATNRLILRETLSLWGCIVTEASGGAAGLKELEKAKETGHPFRIAILDSQMPEMDGLTLARKIRGKPDFVALSILMLTSERRSRDRIKAKAADITGYLVKPVKRDALRNALRVAMGREEILRKPQKPQEELPADDLRPLRILLVEDSEDNRFLVQAYLKNTKYLIDMAGNGQVAVEKFLSNVYDLILMDVQMPVMDGYMATREIRRIEREEGRKPSPIVALTAHALKEDKEKSLEIGFDDYLTKPIRKPVLLEAIRKFTSAGSGEVNKFLGEEKDE